MWESSQTNNQQTVTPAALRKYFETFPNLIGSWMPKDAVEKVHLESVSINIK